MRKTFSLSHVWLVAAGLVVLGGGAPSALGAVNGSVLTATLPAAGGSPRGVFATHAPGRPNELFVVDQRGLIQVLNLATGTFASTPFLDIQTTVDDTANEQGLLGLAFAPDFATSGHFYVNYTYDPAGAGLDRTRVERYTVASPLTGLSASVGTARSVLEFDQDFDNHNGGWIGFSPTDGLLYIATGDGGSGNDPNNRAQSLNTRLGKMLRVDPTLDDFPTSTVSNFGVPATNPFANDGNSSTLGEIWAYGLRNPWRSSFDRANGDLWIGDVGQGAREEIDRQANGAGGANFGWRLREGDIQTPSVGGAIPPNYVAPVYDYPSDGAGQFGGNSVVGGYVYRGPDATLQGTYFFGDSFPSQLWRFNPTNPDGTVQNLDSLLNPSNAIGTPVSFAEDAVGNLYIIDLDGQLFRIDTGFATGDYNLDGQIDGDDRSFWAIGYGSGGDWPDGNNDGVVNAADYTLWRDAAGASTSSAVPESVSLWLAALAAASSISARRPPLAKK
jgi:glucose/arabinose dehydrogenase